ncbi:MULTISPECIES: CBS domain-containing protein [Sphingomonas]|uniref:CBS domain-containing protein n=1 Tax=Sphingomonas TaxID=13687 RepID=UPI0020BD8724|nr:CBS domain-containing protein [Sphingomonas faeni]MCK8458171.1 CBS domain-containing protein [Sphingomonas faeni]
MTIAAILNGKGAADVQSLHPDSTVAGAVALLAEKRIGAAPVIENGRVVGIFSERDVIHCLQADGAAALDRRIGDVMTTAVKSIGSNESAIGALSLMTQRRIRHLPVIDGDTLVGFVSIGDLVKYRIDRIEADAAAMREYIQSA